MSQDESPPKPPAFDDFGNRVNPMPGRTVTRNAGCYNCIHFDSEEVYKRRIESCYTRDVMVFKMGRNANKALGITARPALSQRDAAKKANLTRQLLLGKAGFFGVCKTDGVQSDFTSSRHLCSKWTGTQDAHLAREIGEPLSPLIEEVYDKRGEIDMIKAKPAEAPADDATPETSDDA